MTLLFVNEAERERILQRHARLLRRLAWVAMVGFCLAFDAAIIWLIVRAW
jgi:hypothetical protein